MLTSSARARDQEGAIAIAKGLAGNTTLLQLDLMGMPKLGMSERVLTAFIDMYATNFHLKKITWRLDHRLANTLARLVTLATLFATLSFMMGAVTLLLEDDHAVIAGREAP